MKYQTINALLVHKKKCTNKPKLHTTDKVNLNCNLCEYNGKHEKDMQQHIRVEHLNVSTSSSPPPKRKRASNYVEEEEKMVIDSDDIVSIIIDMDITEKENTEEEKELKKRSTMMVYHEMYFNLIHDDSDSYICDQCNYEAPKDSNLEFHMMWKHSTIPLEFKCELCEFNALSVTDMRSHLLIEHKEISLMSSNFTSSRQPMCTSCLVILNETAAEYEWPSWTCSDGPLKCDKCLQSNLIWWSDFAKRPMPKDVLRLSDLATLNISD